MPKDRRARQNSRPLKPAPDSEEPKASAESFLVVGLGASAGGLEAFEKFFSRMPSDSGMAFVVVSHLAPGHKSLLAEILAKRTTMPVEQVATDTEIEPNHVYVIRPNTTLELAGKILRVISPPEETRAQRTPIDTLFRSLAEEQRENAVCILLSGTGTDGTIGLRAIKEFGGMAMAHAAETARYDSILRSAIATGLVDHVLAVEEMPDRLLEYAVHLRKHPKSTSEFVRTQTLADLLDIVYGLLRNRTGHDFSHYKENTILRRIFRRMQVRQIESVDAYVNVLKREPKEVDLLFRDFLIGVTHFFRDPEAFEALAHEVVPKLFEDKLLPDQSVRVCVYGCASGEETYTIAILLREHMEKLDGVPRVQIFATDIDEEALEIARMGCYSSGIVDYVSQERLDRFFTKIDNSYQVTKEIREMCIFSTHSLIKDPPFSKMDLITCRNVLIYLGPEVQKKIVPLFHYALRPNGYLFLGPSETMSNLRDLFRTVDKTNRIFQRKEHVTRPPIEFSFGDIPRTIRPALELRRARPEERNMERTLQRIVLEKFAPAAVITDEHGNAVYFSGRVGKFLELHPGTPSHDITSLAREDLRLHLRSAIHKAAMNQERVVREKISVQIDGGVQDIRLTVHPLSDFGQDANLYISIFEELSPPRSKIGGEPPAEGSQEDSQVRQLEQELRATKEHLQSTVEELETSNEELRSSLEEFQSTNEELETSKEELQSLNEEMETVNAELTRKITALDQANSDIQSLLENTQIATLFLDRDFHIQRFTPAIASIFRLIPSDLGRPITDIAPRIAGIDLEADARQVLSKLNPIERELQVPHDDRWHIMRILPYRTEQNEIDGVVITFIDVTNLKKAEQATRESKIYSERIIEAMRSPLVVLDAGFKVRFASPSFYQAFHLTPKIRKTSHCLS